MTEQISQGISEPRNSIHKIPFPESVLSGIITHRTNSSDSEFSLEGVPEDNLSIDNYKTLKIKEIKTNSRLMSSSSLNQEFYGEKCHILKYLH